jgi:hypothetical protein
MERLGQAIDQMLKQLESVRLDGMFLYICGVLYYTYLHWKHDAEISKGLKGSNGMWEAPELVVYYWLQSFPFILFGDAFLGLHLSDGMMWVFILILFFAIMGRAGLELILSYKGKLGEKIIDKTDEQK